MMGIFTLLPGADPGFLQKRGAWTIKGGVDKKGGVKCTQAAIDNGKLCCLHCWWGLWCFSLFYETFYPLLRVQMSSLFSNLHLFFFSNEKGKERTPPRPLDPPLFTSSATEIIFMELQNVSLLGLY